MLNVRALSSYFFRARARARARGHSSAAFILRHDKINRITFIVAAVLPRFALRKYGAGWAIILLFT